ncbi:Methylosome subunit pICln [Sciurus carolinensis]|uniref:Methylosome subunit pICln n=1 Tax=Sciurus carolinensis TaxID=30640 RepID=A0AA41NII4_SCICA|nr:Methylosome subunit pICln [Sciurus carolinensis]
MQSLLDQAPRHASPLPLGNPLVFRSDRSESKQLATQLLLWQPPGAPVVALSPSAVLSRLLYNDPSCLCLLLQRGEGHLAEQLYFTKFPAFWGYRPIQDASPMGETHLVALRQNEGLWQQQSDTEAVLNGKDFSTRTLYIAERRLSWLDGSGLRFSLEYPTISLHVMSSDLNAYPPECLYVMVNAKFGAESKESLDEEEEDSDDDVQPITEFRFVPRDKSALEALFTAICECQALHPDPEDEDSDDYDAEKYDVGGLEDAHEQGQGHIPTFYTYEEELFHLTAEGQVTLDRLEGMLSQSVSSPYNIAGVQTEDSVSDYEDGMEVDTTPTVTGQFEDADADH